MEQLGRCAKATVGERFTWEQAAARFLRGYLEDKDTHKMQGSARKIVFGASTVKEEGMLQSVRLYYRIPQIIWVSESL